MLKHKNLVIAIFTLLGITTHLILRFATQATLSQQQWPLILILLIGGTALVMELGIKIWQRNFGSDQLAGIAIITSVFLGEYLAGSLVVLMLSGGEALEAYAVANASSALQALANRLPSQVHRQTQRGVENVPILEVRLNDILVIYPHEVCPSDGEVVTGHGSMDEAYLTGEPYQLSKSPGSAVISGAINGDSVLTIRVGKLPADSRYAKIIEVMRAAQERRPRMRRLGDQLGAYYTPMALAIAGLAWLISGESARFLSVLVVATPCPLLIAIPVAIIGSISLAAKRGIIIRDPVVMEQINACTTMILDKTGTLTYGVPTLTDQFIATGFNANEVLQMVASLEQYSKHPLAHAFLQAAQKQALPLLEAADVSEPPGRGMQGHILQQAVVITSRKELLLQLSEELRAEVTAQLPPTSSGLECVVMIGGRYAATYRFHDGPRADSRPFIEHLAKKHHFRRVMLVSGDRESEVRYLANLVGIKEIYFSQSPEQKVALVRGSVAKEPTLFVGDGINDAPALTTATVGVAMGQRSEVTSEAAGAVVMDNSLVKVDELLHISKRMRQVALQSALGGMALSVVGMGMAAMGFLPAVAGAIMQEVIDVFAIINSLRASARPKVLSDL